jgi:hypothetical protein
LLLIHDRHQCHIALLQHTFLLIDHGTKLLRLFLDKSVLAITKITRLLSISLNKVTCTILHKIILLTLSLKLTVHHAGYPNNLV